MFGDKINPTVEKLLAAKDEEIARLRADLDALQTKFLSLVDPTVINTLRAYRQSTQPSAPRRRPMIKDEKAPSGYREMTDAELNAKLAIDHQGMKELGIL